MPPVSEATAEKLGLSRRTIETAVQLHGLIVDDVRKTISGTWLAGSGAQLMTLGKLTPDQQRKVAFFVVQHPDVRNVGEIVRQLENRPRPPAPEKLEKFLSFWRKCDPDEQQQIVEYAAAQMPSVACNAAWSKASEFERKTIVHDFSPYFPGFDGKEAA
ncbi:hypothetical protein [Gluconobacter morbifer]|uniref:Uncharacterized protein n=1 Tax=Gluconobacter morbifer G707 TaxID=1088869 RepID=G6XH74_9PROT|nr:hypothetical protein [Gluconobacter morbifer]EHH69532.1 hypothetical protein GMO_08390 [Gluconobacter morbifer G707]